MGKTHGSVHVTVSDSGWILEKCARELTSRLPYVSYGLESDPSAFIQYYVTYGCYRGRVSPVQMAFFTHQERDAVTSRRFIDVAREMDTCVCMSHVYEKVLRDAGVGAVQVISPGVDLETFQPRVKIGVVGRTYHTGRKGEALLRQVMDEPGIEWHFTGEGWPGPARRIPDASLPDFYRDMDYILVSSLYEGGPMCHLEALACGVPVIAPQVGFVPELPHIEFRTGDVDDLRRVLRQIVGERMAMRAAVLDRTWDAWAEQHDLLFQKRARERGVRLHARIPEKTVKTGDKSDLQPLTPLPLYLDLTTSAYAGGKYGGTVRVETAVSRRLIERMGPDVRLVVWNNVIRQFRQVPIDEFGTEGFFTAAARGFAGIEWSVPADIPAGARLLVLGSAWNQNGDYTADLVDFAHHNSMRLCVMMHDIIYALFPHWVSNEMAGKFRSNAELLLAGADQVLVYSRCSQRDLGQYSARNDIELPPLAMVTLGDDVPAGDGGQEEVPAGIPAFLGEKPFVLYVSAIGSRKNHTLLHQIWARLSDEGFSQLPHLVCVGRIFPEVQDQVERMGRDPRLRGMVTFLHSIGDDRLAWLYRRCLFTVFPSLYEGWGLPVSESLAFGKVCLAADAGAVTELAPGLVDLIDPLDVMTWLNQVRRYAGDDEARRRREAEIRVRYRSRDWDTATASILAALSISGEPRAQMRRIALGETINLGASGESGFFRNGWHRAEAWGRWSGGGESRLILPLERQPTRSLRLEVDGRAFVSAPHPDLDVTVSANDEAVGTWHYHYPEARTALQSATIPLAVLRRRSLLEVRFQVSDATSPARLGLSQDARVLGIGVSSLRLAEVSEEEEKHIARLQEYHLKKGSPISFGEFHYTVKYLVEGWGTMAPWGVWSIAERAALQFGPSPVTDANLAVSFRMRCFVRPEIPRQRVVANVNGVELETWTIEAGSASVYERRLFVPRDVVKLDDLLTIRFDLPDSRSPQEVGVGPDTRRLGIGLMRLLVEDV